MKLISLLVAICFTMNVFASTGTIQQFERALDEYHYALSVEWDQKDIKFQEQKTDEFFKEMQNLMSAGGLTPEEITSVLEKKMNNKAAVEAMKLKLSLMGGIRSPEEFSKIVRESSSEFYNRGASWNGRVIIPVAVVFVIVAAVGFAVWWSGTHECSGYETQTKCSTQTTCHGTVPNVSCRDEQVCFDSDVCTGYAYTGPHL